ncbi:hypothetical protein MW887_010243 [Aspergillus wentii]|nr:hypothetical protein MW887_010243 [Aspergillus wentii]
MELESPPPESAGQFESRPPVPESQKDARSQMEGSDMVIYFAVGSQKRLFAARWNMIRGAPLLATYCREQSSGSGTRPKPINMPDEQPEIFSCVLEYLYTGDYYPRLVHDKSHENLWLEDSSMSKDVQSNEATIYHQGAEAIILKDTAVYCAAEKYGIENLKRLSLRKQGLHCGIQCSTILTSARYAYANTPDTESKLRAHYLALIIRSRSTFKRSGTMQMEMEQGGKLFFDLFVAMCNHMDDLDATFKAPLAD